MRKAVIIFVFVIALVACNQENKKVETPSNTKANVTVKQEETTPNYNNVFIYEVTETSILIAPPATDPEASYPVFEIFIDQDTKIEGSKDKFDELTEDDDVKVWVRRKGEGKEFAKKIVVK
ncbi:hypothetical protein [Evansella tamaricis]|uniref:Lipoprotein n=1 Tax=Evansella tamaricis TaxID=2069301 RepID=A0ABS6JJ70_9BACI|nr:hypothetical protein [Evansella tamaricis]MBU9713583.1 hypothetical protein [Evansella tamaricis]